jgi:hypothetical protein
VTGAEPVRAGWQGARDAGISAPHMRRSGGLKGKIIEKKVGEMKDYKERTVR